MIRSISVLNSKNSFRAADSCEKRIHTITFFSVLMLNKSSLHLVLDVYVWTMCVHTFCKELYEFCQIIWKYYINLSFSVKEKIISPSAKLSYVLSFDWQSNLFLCLLLEHFYSLDWRMLKLLALFFCRLLSANWWNDFAALPVTRSRIRSYQRKFKFCYRSEFRHSQIKHQSSNR